MRLEFVRVLWVWGWRARAGYQTPAFAGKNRLYLAHGRERSLAGSWRGVTGLRRASCGFGVDAARGGSTRPLRSRARTACVCAGPNRGAEDRSERRQPEKRHFRPKALANARRRLLDQAPKTEATQIGTAENRCKATASLSQ